MGNKFVSGANTLQFTVGTVYTQPQKIAKQQVAERTASGILQTEDYGVTIKSFTLVFLNMSEVDYNDLATWYDTISDGVLNSFTYYDAIENTYTVVIRTNPLQFTENDAGFYSGRIELEIV